MNLYLDKFMNLMDLIFMIFILPKHQLESL